jgi:DNA-directed RNA polymerase specialized sigma24 family protein
LLQNVIEEVPAPRLNASKCDVTGKNRTRERFEQVFLANYSCVVSVLRRIVGDHARAEDLANEVFLKLYRQPMPTNAIDNVPGWLYRTATNLGIDGSKRQSPRDSQLRFIISASATSKNKVDRFFFSRKSGRCIR